MSEKAELLERINLDYPGLEAAKEFHKKNDLDGCIDKIIEHFVTRTSPEYFFTLDDVKKNQDPRIIEDAEEVLRHHIYGYDLGKDIDWLYNPTHDTSKDNEWSWSLFRNIYWQPLARAYAMTGDEKYAKEFIAQFKSFEAAWPVEPYMDGDTFESSLVFPGHAWRSIEAGIRIYTTWLPCFVVFRKSPSWDKDAWIKFLNLISDHAEFLITHYSNHSRPANWLTMEATALLQMGIFFPEMKNAEVWKLNGYQRVMHEIKYSFDNDGIHAERTPIYHLVSSICFLQGILYCKMNGILLPPYAIPTIIKSAEYLMSLVKPDFSTPMIGDSDRNDLLARRSDEATVYEGMNLTFDPFDLNELRAYFRKFAELSDREDFLWLATGRKKGIEPKTRNYKFTDAGCYIMRTGWSSQDSYMLVSAAQLERGQSAGHAHNDVGHLELSIKGDDVLIDAGRYIYRIADYKDWREYFVSAKAHNTVYIDNHIMGSVPNSSLRSRGTRTYCHNFIETDLYQMIDISHNGYAFMEDPVFHRRRVIRLPGDIFVIDDDLSGMGHKKHDIRLYFNFPQGSIEKTDNKTCIYTNTQGRKYKLINASGSNTDIECLNGSENPKGGWISYGYSVRIPAPQVCFKTESHVPLRFITVLGLEDISAESSGSGDNISLKFYGKQKLSLLLQKESIEVIGNI